ncbi:hypothetical protein FIU89_02280 [Roseovarius sp. THAF27]|uniref:hypothetical protein n=1 Tax=Roseovarius sp. THAF27 TaxID=2587850 RepID=UPI001268F8D2|nr:hypothetical protein [Roseovarius sp. THAF27]QFT79422.1 hypothetical protein FIU89_02280 [Roseovarius sp. THAF27]
MHYDRAEIMKAAWVIVRRFHGNGEPFKSLMSRALVSAWDKARQKASVARRLEQSRREAETLAARTSSQLAAETTDLDNRSYLGHEGQEKLRALRAAHTAACEREAQEAKRALIDSARGRFASVTFTKKDGTERVMRVQPATLKYHVKGSAASEAAQKAVQARAERHPHLMPLWDAEAQAPRSVNLATISRIAVNGAVHEYAIH